MAYVWYLCYGIYMVYVWYLCYGIGGMPLSCFCRVMAWSTIKEAAQYQRGKNPSTYRQRCLMGVTCINNGFLGTYQTHYKDIP